MKKSRINPIFCTSNSCPCCLRRFDNLCALIDCSELTFIEKSLWMWIATQCAKISSETYQCSYEQLSLAMNLTCKQIHCALTRLKVIGFLIGDSPIWYYELTQSMLIEVYTLKPIVPDKVLFEKIKCFRTNSQKPIHMNE